MILQKRFLQTMSFLLSLTFLVGMPFEGMSQEKKKMKKKDKTKVYITELGQKYEVIGWEADVIYNPFAYSYTADVDPLLTDVDPVLKKIEFERPPVFGSECLTADDPEQCTNERIQEFVSENIEYPNWAQENLQEGLEYVTFTLAEDGKYEGNFKVLSKNDPCKGCEEKAVDMVSKMEGKWYPALDEGEPVKTKITLPVKFDLINK